jgi:hypothetical protein
MSFNTNTTVQHRAWNLFLAADAGPVPLIESFYFAITPAPYVTPGEPFATGPALTERNRFLSDVNSATPNNAGVVDFTLTPVEPSQNGTPINVAFYGGATANSLLIEAPVKQVLNYTDSGEGPSGRFNTTTQATIVARMPQGGNPVTWYADRQTYLEFQSDATCTFATPVSFFGFYGTDWGDFAGRAVIRVYYVDDTFTDNYLPDDVGYPDGNLIFWGLIANKLISKFQVYLDPANLEDFFGVDDILAGVL